MIEDGHAGQAYLMTGPEVLTQRQQVEHIADALGEPIRYVEVTAEEGREILRSYGGWAADNADFLMGFEGFSEGDDLPDVSIDDMWDMLQPLPTVEQVLGRPPCTFGQWAQDHVDDFR